VCLEGVLSATVVELENRHKFCNAVVKGEIVLFGREKKQLELDLKVNKQIKNKLFQYD
jgi:hypothetical protein